ncbi:hypothetical protein [Membranihabitans maritimus]|uniref:hypothetical protein n=1 Tax=Membranihabitans maritimus TaxID=2904244 RepID=UPI001F2BDD71|nr:hypothetical protein [Membranihabitans maritimus]
MGNFNSGQLKRLKEIFEELEYQVIFGKGQFKSGYCIIQDKKMIVVNKYFDTDGKVETLLEIMDQIEDPKEILLSKPSMKYLHKLYERITEIKN